MTNNTFEERLARVEQRNVRVEAEKAWETSWVRRILLVSFTYITIGTYMWIIQVSRPWLNAIVPAIGFMISTLSMPFFKALWLKRFTSKTTEVHE
jgi:hypothetical protein